MTDVTSRLRLVVDSTGLDRSGRKLRTLRRETKKTDDAARRLKTAFAGLAGVIGAAFSLQQLTKVADSYRGIQNQLRLVTNGARELEAAQSSVLKVANETGASLTTTVRLYANLERFAGDFLDNQQETLDLTRAINQAAVVSGASVVESSNAIRQLTQAIAGGILRAEEFNSIMENLPRLGEAIADGLGIGIGELRRQVSEGLVTSQVLIEALQKEFKTINEEFLGAAKTIGQAWQAVGNILTVEIGQRLQGVQTIVIDALQFIGANIANIIPIIEGVGAALLALGAKFAISALPAVAAGLAALLSPLGLLAIAIAGVVAFRDDIAEWAFGVRDAGAVVSAALEMLAPLFGTLKDAVVGFANAAIPAIIEFAQAAVEPLRIAGEAVLEYVAIINEAVERVRIEEATRKLEGLAAQQRALVDQITELRANPTDDLLAGLGSGFERGSDRIAADLDKILDAIAVADEELTKLLSPGDASALNQTFDELARRAREIAEARGDAAEAEERVRKEVEKTTAATKEQIKNAKALQKIHDDIAAQQEIVNAARLGEHQERVAREILNIRRQIADISIEEARALAEQNVFLDEQLEIIREQRSLIEAPFDNLADNLADAIVNGGRDGVDGLKSVFKNFFNDIKTSFVKSLLSPITQAIKNLPNSIGVPIFGPGAGIGGAGGISGSLLGTSAIGSVVGAGGLGFLGGTLLSDLFGLGGAGRGALTGASTGFLLGSVVPGLGNAIGAIGGAIIGGFSGLFGPPPSNQVGQVAFNPLTGRNVGTGVDRGGEQNLQIAQEIASQVSAVASELADLIGADVSRLINVEVGRNSGITIGFQGPGRILDPQNFANSEAGAIDAINAGIRQTVQSLRGGDQALLSIATALAQTDIAADELISHLSLIAPLIAEVEEPLTAYEQALKDINAVFDDAVAAANGLASAEIALNNARRTALAAAQTRERMRFDDQIQADIGQFLNGPLDQLELLLKGQEERLVLAQQIGADLAEVERLTALELRDFFRGLSEQGLEEVQSFLGLFEEATNSVVRNLDLSRQDLQSQRDAFSNFATQFADQRTSNIERFIAASPRESLDILRGRANELLTQVGEGNQSAAQALPQVLGDLLTNARQTFGNTQGFTDVFNFVQDTLKSAEDASLQVVSDTELQIAALDESNVILSDIRDILASSQAFNAFLQSGVSGGIASGDELLALIQQGAGLSLASNDNAAALNITGIIGQSVQPIVLPIANSIDAFTQRLAEMPDLQRLQIESTDRVADAVNDSADRLELALDRIEILNKKILQAQDAA